MTQVLCVSKYDGKYEFLDKEGRFIDLTNEAGIISGEDADILLERIRQGYQQIPVGHYVLRLELLGEDYVGSHFEFTEMITFDLDDDGYQIPKCRTLVSQLGCESTVADLMDIEVASAFIDYEARIVTWMDNPFADNPEVFNPSKAAVCQYVNTDMVNLMEICGTYLMKDKPVHCARIQTRFNME